MSEKRVEQVYNTRIVVQLTSTMKEEFFEACTSNNLRASEVLRSLISEYIHKNK